MKATPFICASAISVAALIGATSASYADVQYVVDGTFNDGGTVTGYFDINVYGYLDGFDLTTTGGTTLATGYDYTSGTTYTASGTTYVTFSRAEPKGYEGALQFGFSSPLGGYNAQPIVTGVGGTSWETSGYVSGEDVPPAPVRYLEAGSTVTGVPELSTWLMLLAGFAGLGVAGVRRAPKAFIAL